MEKDKTTMCPIYGKDYDKVRDFKERKGLRTYADAIRICVEFADSHGVFK